MNDWFWDRGIEYGAFLIVGIMIGATLACQ